MMDTGTTQIFLQEASGFKASTLGAFVSGGFVRGEGHLIEINIERTTGDHNFPNGEQQ